MTFADREPIRVSALALEAMAAGDGGRVTYRDTYHVTEPPPGVLPKGVTGESIAMDAGWEPGAAAGYARSIGWHEGLYFPGFAYLAELTQRAEFRKISETIAKEMTRKWIRVTATGDKTAKEGKIAELVQAIEDFKLEKVFRALSLHDGFFGRAHLFIDIAKWRNDPAELQTLMPVQKGKLGKGCLKNGGFRTVEPIWVYPAQYNASKPLEPDFYRPNCWYVMGQQIHRTRLLPFVSREVPDMLKPAYSFAGLSMTQMAKPYVDNWLRTRQSVSDILHAFSVMVLATNLSQIQNTGGLQNLQMRLQLFNMMRDNRGIFAVDKDTEEFTNVAAPLGTLDHLQAQAQEQMASVSGIPLVKLLGVTPSGLNASSDGEIRCFYDNIAADQKHVFSDHLRTVLDVLMIHLWGDVDKDITFEFEPLWQLDEAAQATVRKTDADTDIELVDAGILHPEEVRARIAAEKDSPYAGLDVDDVPEEEEIQPDDPRILPDPARTAEPKSEERSGV